LKTVNEIPFFLLAEIYPDLQGSLLKKQQSSTFRLSKESLATPGNMANRIEKGIK
jgi:hypothetical protein